MSGRERLALFDLDGTLIGDDYEVNDPDFTDVVRAAQDVGWTIGLNSDTPYAALCVWRERFAMNGPIVAEKGAVVEVAGEPVFDEMSAEAVAKACARVIELSRRQGAAVWSGNPVEAIRDNMPYGEPGQTVVLINELSLCSLRYFVRVAGEGGRLKVDPRRMQQILDGHRPLFPGLAGAIEDINLSAGLVTASPQGTSKRAGTQRLLAAMGLDGCVMVGNSMSDYLGSDIARHYAVGNATSEYRALAESVPARLTRGCAALLRKLAGQAKDGKNELNNIE